MSSTHCITSRRAARAAPPGSTTNLRTWPPPLPRLLRPAGSPGAPLDRKASRPLPHEDPPRISNAPQHVRITLPSREQAALAMCYDTELARLRENRSWKRRAVHKVDPARLAAASQSAACCRPRATKFWAHAQTSHRSLPETRMD